MLYVKHVPENTVPEQINQINHFLSSCFGNNVLTVIESKLEKKTKDESNMSGPLLHETKR